MSDGDDGPAEMYRILREQILDLDPATVGLGPTPEEPTMWGALFETGYPNGVATLVCLRDGTTSLYLSGGGGLIGAGEHAAVVAANAEFRSTMSGQLGAMTPDEDRSLPGDGRVIMRALTYAGRRRFEAAEDDLGYERSELSPSFYAAQDVLTQLRIIDEGRNPPEE
jgi:hypothetical protein